MSNFEIDIDALWEYRMSNFEIDIDALIERQTRTYTPYLGVLCRNPNSCQTCQFLRGHRGDLIYSHRGHLRFSQDEIQAMRNMTRRVRRIFVNAIDLFEDERGFPVKIIMLPISVFHSILNILSTLPSDQRNIFHPMVGRGVYIRKRGEGLGTQYTVHFAPDIERIPSDSLYAEIVNNTTPSRDFLIPSLYNLSNVALWFNNVGLLMREAPIARLTQETNFIRILPPYDHTRRIHSELNFHYRTIEDVLAPYEENFNEEDNNEIENRPPTTLDPEREATEDERYTPILPTTGTSVSTARREVRRRRRQIEEIQRTQQRTRRELMFPTRQSTSEEQTPTTNVELETYEEDEFPF